MKQRAGFTLIELIIVLLLMGGILVWIARAFVSSAHGRDQLAGSSQLAGEVSTVLYNIDTDAARAGSLSLSPSVALYLSEHWPVGEDSVEVVHGDDYDTLTFRWAESGACSDSNDTPLTIGSESVCIVKARYRVNDEGELVRSYKGSEESIAGFKVEEFHVFWGTADGWQWNRPSPEDARAIGVYLRVSVPYDKPKGCGTYPSSGLLDPYGDEVKNAIGETTYSGDACLRLVQEDVVEFPLANTQHW